MSTLEGIVSKIESKYGMKGRVWVFDRGVVSEDNLQELRERGAYYLVGTPRRKLADFEHELLTGDWQEIAGNRGCANSKKPRRGLSFCPGDGWLSVPSLGPSASAGSPKTMSGFPPRWQVCTGSRSLSSCLTPSSIKVHDTL